MYDLIIKDERETFNPDMKSPNLDDAAMLPISVTYKMIKKFTSPNLAHTMIELSKNRLVTIGEGMLEFWDFNIEKRIKKLPGCNGRILHACKLFDDGLKLRLLTAEDSKFLRIWSHNSLLDRIGTKHN